MKIRWHLVLLVSAALLPVLVFAAILTGLFWSQQRATLDRGFLEGVRALTIALDAEINSSIHSLQALALSPELDADYPAGFSETVGRVLKDREGWSTIALVDSAGKEIFRMGKPPGQGGLD
jgi:sensor domain CHASE-containing protein